MHIEVRLKRFRGRLPSMSHKIDMFFWSEDFWSTSGGARGKS